ncbi:hypothetical protein, partial [Mycobacterium avium]|uniref:hypothetical protein n=1 Tax=Mycobacterium avium TaxID=1764 RepID=UPI000AE59DC1
YLAIDSWTGPEALRYQLRYQLDSSLETQQRHLGLLDKFINLPVPRAIEYRRLLYLAMSNGGSTR